MPTEGETFSAKGAARKLGTDARTLRKFLRSDASPFEPVGQGARYVFDEELFEVLKTAFEEWLGEDEDPTTDWYEGTDYPEDPF